MNNKFENQDEESVKPMKSEPKTVAAIGGENLYPLDWKTIDVTLAKGRFTHTLARPSNELLMQREAQLKTEIGISKDGSYNLPDETEQEELDAKYYDAVKQDATGYGAREIPTLHKATAFQGLFKSSIEVDEDCDIFDEEITVNEEIGTGDEPDFVVRHVLRQPDEKELNKLRKIFRNSKITPDKNGRQKIVTASNLRQAMSVYAAYLVRLDGAKVGDEAFSDERRQDFINNVNVLTQRAVIRVFVEKLSGSLSD